MSDILIWGGGGVFVGLILGWLFVPQPRWLTRAASKAGIKDRVPLLALLLLPFLGGCLAPSTTVHTQKMPNGDVWTYICQASAVSPNTVTVIDPAGNAETFATGSSMGQLAGPAAVAAAGYMIGDGIKEAPADTTEVSQSGGGATANAEASADVDASTYFKGNAWVFPGKPD